MLRYKIRIVLFLSVVYSLLAAVFSACAGDDEHSGSRPVEILVSTGFDPVTGVETRGEGSVDAQGILSGKALPVSVVRTDYDGSDYLPYSITEGVGYWRAANLTKFNKDIRVKFTTDEYYQTDGEATKLIGWYPPVGNGSTWAVNIGVATVEFPIDGQTDVLMSDLVEGSIGTPFDTGNPLTFSHLLTRIRIRVYAFESDVTGHYGGIKSITVKSQSTCTATLPAVNDATNTKPTTAFSGTIIDCPLVRKDPDTGADISYGEEMSFAIPLTDKDEVKNNESIGLVGYAIIAPTQEITFEIVTEKKTINACINVSLTNFVDAFAAGKSYSLALQFAVNVPVTVTLGQQDWVDGGNIIIKH